MANFMEASDGRPSGNCSKSNSAKGETELLEVKYFQAATITTNTLVNFLVQVLSLTLWATNGYKNLYSYCRKGLKWKPSSMAKIFFPSERAILKKCPVFEPFSPSLNFKLLKKAFREMGKRILKQVEALDRLLLMACHAPPRLPNRDHLLRHLQKLFAQQIKLRDAVVQYSLGVLEEKLSNLTKEAGEIKDRLDEIFTDVCELRLTLVSVALVKSSLVIELHYAQTVGNEQCKENVMKGRASIMKIINTSLKKLAILDISLARNTRKYKEVREKIKCVKELYLCIIKKDALPDIAKILCSIYRSNGNSPDLREYHTILCYQRNVRRERLKAIGKQELMSFSPCFASSQVDINKWLFGKERIPLRVKKIYSSLRRTDTDKLLSIEELFMNNIPKYIILTGPIASGKTCLSQYLYDLWQSGDPAIGFLQRTDFVVYLDTENIKSESFTPQLKKMFPKSLGSLRSNEIFALLQTFKVLFIVDTSSAITTSSLDAVKELAESLGRNKIIVTTRPEKQTLLRNCLRNGHSEPITLTIEPLNKPSLLEYCHNTFRALSRFNEALRSTVKCDNFVSKRPFMGSKVPCASRHHSASLTIVEEIKESQYQLRNSSNIEKFCSCLSDDLDANVKEKSLYYPLALSYLIFLWLEDPYQVKNVSSFPELLEAIFSLCCDRLKCAYSEKCAAMKAELMKKVNITMADFYSLSANRTERDSELDDVQNIDFNHCKEVSHISSELSEAFFPFLVCSGFHSIGKCSHKPIFLHPCIQEFLSASRVIFSLDSNKRMTFAKQRLQDIFPVSTVINTGGKYLDTTKFICGALSSKKNLNKTISAHVVKLFQSSGVRTKDYCSWVSLLATGKWQETLVKAVSKVLTAEVTVVIPIHNVDEIRALCALLNRRLLQPKNVSLTAGIPGEVLNALLFCKGADFSIIPSSNYSGIQVGKDQESLLNVLSKIKNIVELWGTLGAEEVQLLRGNTRLHTLHIHILSIKALTALNNSLCTFTSLKEIFLHLDLPFTLSTEIVPQLACPAKVKIILTLTGITGLFTTWAVSLVKQLGHVHQLQLAQSSLSPQELHYIKSNLKAIIVHTCN
ncbi:uncharacterized protein [Palaemon carinicauda]|uniref:uncharacterized protein n=1 Tax=Palaemon carinicauda TaxID=392227 RepID=UPI0035B62888